MAKYHFFSIVLVALSFTSCKKKSSIENFESEIWKADKHGCKEQRLSQAEIVRNAQSKIEGMSKNEIINLFGQPDETNLFEKGQMTYKYYISPGPKCEENLKGQSLEIRMNALGFVSEVHFNIFSTPTL